MADNAVMTEMDVIVLGNGIRYRLGQKNSNGYAEYAKTLDGWRESADISNEKLKQIWARRINNTDSDEIDDFIEATADAPKTMFDLNNATKVIYPVEDPRNNGSRTDLGNKYHRTIYGFCGESVVVDVYRVIDAFNVQSPGLQHAIKKMLLPGTRGHKDRLKDLKEAANSINQAIALEEQKLNDDANKKKND